MEYVRIEYCVLHEGQLITPHTYITCVYTNYITYITNSNTTLRKAFTEIEAKRNQSEWFSEFEVEAVSIQLEFLSIVLLQIF